MVSNAIPVPLPKSLVSLMETCSSVPHSMPLYASVSSSDCDSNRGDCISMCSEGPRDEQFLLVEDKKSVNCKQKLDATLPPDTPVPGTSTGNNGT